MVKNKQEEQEPKLVQVRQKRRMMTRPLMIMMMVAAVVVLGYKLWENPQVIEQIREHWISSEAKEDVYQPQINLLQEQVAGLQRQLARVEKKAANPDFSAVDKRIDDIEQISVNTIKSKADVDTVLGLVVRMDKAEVKIDDLAKVTDDGALILTAAMLVKDAAARGGTFVYEAEVLDELARGRSKVAKEIAVINKAAAKGVPSVEELQAEFLEAYALRYPEPEELPAENWKERVYNQLHKVIKIKKVGEEETPEKEFSEEDRACSIIRDFVAKGEIDRAIAIARKPLNAALLEDKKVAEWLEHAEERKSFYDSISRITANALAVMKVKFLKNER